MSQGNMTNASSWFVDFPSIYANGVKISNSSILTLYQWKTLVPIDISVLLSLVVLLSGILCNAFLGLYVGEKLRKNSGVRTLLCNQIFTNLVALFSFTFVPLRVLDEEPPWNLQRLCKVMPSMGFLAISVSLTNLAAISVANYRGKKYGKFANCSTRASLLVVAGSWMIAAAMTIPLGMSLQTVEVKVNQTMATMCVGVWSHETYRDIFMNCVLIVKFAAPTLLMISVCVKMELLRLKEKNMEKCREVSDVVVNVVAAICFLLLVYFFPLGFLGKGKFLSPSPAAVYAADIVQICELIALANCAIVPLILTTLVEQCHGNEQEGHCPIDTKGDEAIYLAFPSNKSYITYDVLTADMPEKWRPSPSRVLIV